MVRIFPSEALCLRLVSALTLERSEEWQERRYLDMSIAEPESSDAEEEKDAA